MGNVIDPMVYGADCAYVLTPSGPFDSGKVPKYMHVDVSGVTARDPASLPYPMSWINKHFGLVQDRYGWGAVCLWSYDLSPYYGCYLHADSPPFWLLEVYFYGWTFPCFRGRSTNWLDLTLSNELTFAAGYDFQGGTAQIGFGL
ncbi:MAG: hypothetical protein PHP98_11290 [Kiritimatiellae bacterium]|nr:hypothetical protein [Kiritimatiellia bacterium]